MAYEIQESGQKQILTLPSCQFAGSDQRASPASWSGHWAFTAPIVRYRKTNASLIFNVADLTASMSAKQQLL